MKSGGLGHAIFRYLAHLMSLTALIMIGFAVYRPGWYWAFGLVLFLTSLICTLAAYYVGPDSDLTQRSTRPVEAEAERERKAA